MRFNPLDGVLTPLALGVSKKTKKPIKPRKSKEKKPKKKPIKPNKILKKQAGSVWFYKQKTGKTEPNPNRKKPEKNPSQTGKTEPKPEKPSQIGLNKFLS